MKKLLCLLIATTFTACTFAKEKPRPKILEIRQVRILTSDAGKARSFYYGLLRALYPGEASGDDCHWCEQWPAAPSDLFEFTAVPKTRPKNFIGAVVFRTNDAAGLRQVLRRNGVKAGRLTKTPAGGTFSVLDPERHRLIFDQIADGARQPFAPKTDETSPPTAPHVIHVGLVVSNRAAMDHFYRDILGFRLYWQGGMKEGQTNWVDMQVPDGTDWVEYMLNVPGDADRRTLGVMNHVALGVLDMRTADDRLLQSSLHLPINEAPKIGRDGKWQLNLYDPDDTRVELMEFVPAEKPCCSPYLGPHPGPSPAPDSASAVPFTP